MNNEKMIDIKVVETITNLNNLLIPFSQNSNLEVSVENVQPQVVMEDGDTIPAIVDVKIITPFKVTEEFKNEVGKLETELLENYDILINFVNYDYEEV